MLAFIVLASMLAGLLLFLGVADEVRQRRVRRLTVEQERLRIRRAQFAAERCLQRVTEAAFQDLLDEARGASHQVIPSDDRQLP